MQPLLWQQLNHLTDHLINVSETVNQPTYCEQLPITSTTNSPQGYQKYCRRGAGGWGGEFQRQFEAYKYRTRTIDVSETNLKCLSDFGHFFFIVMTKVATNKTSTSTEEYVIKYFFDTFITSLMTSFYKEAYELSVLNTKKSLCSGVPQSPR